jgi:hypothetical protein
MASEGVRGRTGSDEWRIRPRNNRSPSTPNGHRLDAGHGHRILAPTGPVWLGPVRPGLTLTAAHEANIRQGDRCSVHRAGANLAGMDIAVRVDELHPPVGSVHADDGPVRDFVGWSGLIGVLSDLLERTAGSGCDQLAASGHRELGEDV